MQQLFSLSLSEVRFVSRRKARRDRGESVSHSARAHDMEAASSVGVGAERACNSTTSPHRKSSLISHVHSTRVEGAIQHCKVLSDGTKVGLGDLEEVLVGVVVVQLLNAVGRLEIQVH